MLHEADGGLLIVQALVDEILGPLVTEALLGSAVVDVDVCGSEAVVFALYFDELKS